MNDNSNKRADYGIDAPQVVLRLFVFGAMAISLGIAAGAFFGVRQPWFHIGVWSGGSMVLSAILMVWGSKVAKVSLCERLLDKLKLTGGEQVLDVGCGRGLFLIGAARRLTTGKAVGVDLWQTEDQSGNSPEVTRENARVEGVTERVDIKTSDARQLPFAEESFDIVVSGWALHNVYEAAGRAKALQEIERVLKPGGRVAIIDIRHTTEYARELEKHRFEAIRRSGPNFAFLIPSYVLLAQKKRGGQEKLRAVTMP